MSGVQGPSGLLPGLPGLSGLPEGVSGLLNDLLPPGSLRLSGDFNPGGIKYLDSEAGWLNDAGHQIAQSFDTMPPASPETGGAQTTFAPYAPDGSATNAPSPPASDQASLSGSGTPSASDAIATQSGTQTSLPLGAQVQDFVEGALQNAAALVGRTAGALGLTPSPLANEGEALVGGALQGAQEQLVQAPITPDEIAGTRGGALLPEEPMVGINDLNGTQRAGTSAAQGAGGQPPGVIEEDGVPQTLITPFDGRNTSRSVTPQIPGAQLNEETQPAQTLSVQPEEELLQRSDVPNWNAAMRVGQYADALKLSLALIPPLLREGETVQTSTRLALFRTMLPDGQQVFVDSRGRVVGLAVPPGTSAAQPAQTLNPDMVQLQNGPAIILKPGESRLAELIWSTVLPSCIGLLLVLAGFVSAAYAGGMPWIERVLFLLGAVGFAAFTWHTWRRWRVLPAGSVTRMPTLTRRLRLLTALSCSMQGAGAILLGTATVLF